MQIDGQPVMRFEMLIERHHDEIYRYLWQLLNSSRSGDEAIEVQDITQEVFLRAYQAFGRLQPESNTRAWLYKIATNCAYTLLKRSQRRSSHVLLENDEDGLLVDKSPSPSQHLAMRETLESLHEAVTGLPVKQRAAVVMRYLHELSYGEIAEALHCSEESARANVYQATRSLRREFGRQGVEVEEMMYE